MEDALAQKSSGRRTKRPLSINPCCNGRCTRTVFGRLNAYFNPSVLILVVMEDALAQG